MIRIIIILLIILIQFELVSLFEGTSIFVNYLPANQSEVRLKHFSYKPIMLIVPLPDGN